MKKLLHLLSLALISTFATQAPAQSNYTLYSDIPYKTISGVNQNLLSLDVYKPALFTGNRPVMIYIHGGYWYGGDKDNVGSKATLFTDNGYVFVSINYRLSPFPVDTLSTTAVRFPIHPQDCADAVKWVFDHISTYSGDTSKISLIGHSAGAHLVLLLSTNHAFLQNAGVHPQSIKCSCSLDCGVFDLIEELQQAGNNIARRAPLINAFGTDPSLHDDASPQHNLEAGKHLPWMYLVHQNTSDRVYSNIRFKDSLAVNGYSDASLFNANPYDHGTINGALGNAFDSIGLTTSVMQFFDNCLTNQSTTGLMDWDYELQTLSIYPNPANALLTLSGLKEDFKGTISIYNAMGQRLYSERKSGPQFSVETAHLKNGIYFIQVKTASGKETNRKFIKE